jgi:hypothetical protein
MATLTGFEPVKQPRAKYTQKAIKTNVYKGFARVQSFGLVARDDTKKAYHVSEIVGKLLPCSLPYQTLALGQGKGAGAAGGAGCERPPPGATRIPLGTLG